MAKKQRQRTVAPIPEENPKWLQSDPEGQSVDPPVRTRSRQLPFTGLEWKDFERLCYRLAERAGNVEQVWSYGTSGQAQYGIDILVRLADGGYEVWQTKRYQSITKANISAAIDLFLAHSWAARANRFILAVACNLDNTGVVEAIEAAASLLKGKSIALDPFDAAKLTDRLRVEPEIVDDFFDRPWAEAVCPPEAREILAGRLSRFGRGELRGSLRRCYGSWVSTVDPGLPIAGLDRLGRTAPAIPLVRRYVAPDILVRAADLPYQSEQVISGAERQANSEEPGVDVASNQRRGERQRRERISALPLRYNRIGLDRFLLTESRAVISGDAGAGKSTLLRAIALDLLADAPVFAASRERYANYIPVWVPFALWTRMASERAVPPSLDDVVAAFLQAQGEHELANEMRKALKTSKILLLIDGLDEASDATTARTIAALLAAQVENRNTPILVTTRPHGIQTMGSFAGTWAKVELAPLSDSQRHSLAKLWFRVLEELESEGQIDETKLEAQAQHRARSLTSSLSRNPGISKLSQTPLFLLALMELHRHGHQLPRSRFAAIEKIVGQLVEHQPRRRETEALVTASSSTTNVRLRDRLLDDFAFALHMGALAGSVTDAATEQSAVGRAAEIVLARLGTQDRDAAETLAKALLEFAEERAGVLVKKAAGTIGFLHLSIQEFLSARYLAQLPLARRTEFVRRQSEIPRWREPILYLLYLTKNESEVGELIRAIDDAAISDASGNYARDSLLTDAVFADFAHDIEVARRAADRLLDEAELSAWGEHQRHILLSAIDGLGSEAVAHVCESRIARWVPNRHGYARASAIRAMVSWPRSTHDSCRSVLLRSLSADEESTWRAAAEVLPLLGNTDGTRVELQRLIRTGASTDLVTSSLYALGCGWAADPNVGALAATVRSASDPAIVLEAIRLRAKREETDDDDFERFFDLTFTEDRLLDRLPNRDLISHFVATRRSSLAERLSTKIEQLSDRRPHSLFALIGGLILCEPGSPLVQAGMRDLLKQRWIMRDVFSRSGFPAELVPWTADLVAEVEDFANSSDAAHSDYELFWIAKVLPLPSIKAQILKNLLADNYFRFWSARALVEVWGRDDKEVQAALLPFLDSAPADIASLADALPLVSADVAACRAAFLRSLRAATIRVDLLFKGLRTLGVSQDDDELYKACLEAGSLPRSPLYQEQWRENMIRTFPRRPEVRELALQEIVLRGGEIGAVAQSYGDDEEITSGLLKVLTPLREDARLVLTAGLQAAATADLAAAKLLEGAIVDHDGAVSTEATIGWVESLSAKEELSTTHINTLAAQLHVVGHDYEERRAAAVVSLAIAGRLDLFAQATDARGELLNVRASPGLTRDSDRYARRILQYWPQFVDAVGGEPQAIARLRITTETFLPLIEPNHPNAQEMFDYLIKQMPNSPHFPQHQHIRALARFAPGSAEMRSLILPLLTDRHGGEYWAGLLAAEIFAEYFSEDVDLREQVFQAFEREPRGYATAALAELLARKHDAKIESAVRAKTRGVGFDVATHFKLVAGLSPPPLVIENLKNLLRDGLPEIGQMQLARWVPTMVRRLGRDGALRSAMIKSLDSHTNASAKVSFVSLLQRASIDDELRAYASTELKRLETKVGPEIGFDLSTETHRVLRHALIEVSV